jgi:hypothetical protein
MLPKQKQARSPCLPGPKRIQRCNILTKFLNSEEAVGNRLSKKSRLLFQRIQEQISLLRTQHKIASLSAMSHKSGILDIPTCRIFWNAEAIHPSKMAPQSQLENLKPNIMRQVA